jgi:hypothetical protein
VFAATRPQPFGTSPALPPDSSAIPTLLPRSSDFRRHQRALPLGTDTLAGATRLSSLGPLLMKDLQRFESRARAGEGLEVVEVLAAAVRHNRPLRLMVEHGEHILPLTVRPRERLVQAPLPLAAWDTLHWPALRVLQVEPAGPAPDEGGAPLPATPLGPVLWALALRGARADLLPEIVGPAAYRIAPSTDLAALDLSGALAIAVARLQRETAALDDIARWPGMSRERASRLLNGLYLQAGLIVSRAHPAAG